jgi:hypothetical protein
MCLPTVHLLGFVLLDPQSPADESARQIFTEHNLTILASILSILSFFLTVFVLYDTRKLRGFYRFRGRGTALLRDLRQSSQKLSQFLNDFDDFKPQIFEEMGRARAKLRSLERKLSGSTKTSVKRLRKRLTRIKLQTGTEREVREAYVDMIHVIEEIKEYKLDLNWEM